MIVFPLIRQSCENGLKCPLEPLCLGWGGLKQWQELGMDWGAALQPWDRFASLQCMGADLNPVGSEHSRDGAAWCHTSCWAGETFPLIAH